MRTIALLSLLPVLGCSRARAPVTVAPATPRVVVMTYNVNFGIAGDATTIDAIRDGGADVVFLQETTADWERSLRDELGELYPHMTFVEAKGRRIAGGQAVLSKLPVRLETEMQEDWFPAAIFLVETPVGELQVLNVHLRPPFSDSGSVVSGYVSTPKVRRREMSEFWTEIDATVPTLVVGDFNEDVDGRAVKFLAKKGFTSALPEFQPSAKTWRWNTRLGTLTGRLDHVVYGPGLTPTDVTVRDAGRSDHLPILATFVKAD